MKLKITGATNFVNRMFEACGQYQWAREFLKNSIEAQATRVEFGIEWQGVTKKGLYRRTICDNGIGMSREQLLKFFSTLGEGGKPIGTVHENFGVGAKIAALPWNPNGLVVMSWQGGVGSMIWIVLDEDTSEYELVEFKNGGGKHSCVIDPASHKEIDGIDWGAIKPEWIKDNGTVVVFLGSDKHPDTILGNREAGETDIKGLSVYLNTRFWDLSKIDVKVLETRSERRSHWPRGLEEQDDSRRYNGRQAMGAKYYLMNVEAQRGKLNSHDTLMLADDRVKAEWYLWEGERPAIHSYAKRGGYIAIRYGDELFELTSGKVDFRNFGIVESKVQQNLSIILEPKKYTHDEHWGVHPDQSRNRLIFTAPNIKGVGIPLWEWGLNFAEQMPEDILKAIKKARGDTSGTIDSEEYRRRLQDKFGSRWAIRRLVEARPHEESKLGTEAPLRIEANVPSELEIESEEQQQEIGRQKKEPKTIARKRAEEKQGDMLVAEGDTPVDVPRYRFAKADSFTRPWHMALWAPHDPEGPTVLINLESHVLLEVIQYHQSHYPDVHSEEVADTVRRVFGEVGACKIAHSQKLNRIIPEEELDRDYRSEEALTIGLMGLLAEESVICQRLKHLGPAQNC